MHVDARTLKGRLTSSQNETAVRYPDDKGDGSYWHDDESDVRNRNRGHGLTHMLIATSTLTLQNTAQRTTRSRNTMVQPSHTSAPMMRVTSTTTSTTRPLNHLHTPRKTTRTMRQLHQSTNPSQSTMARTRRMTTPTHQNTARMMRRSQSTTARPSHTSAQMTRTTSTRMSTMMSQFTQVRSIFTLSSV